MDKINGLRYAFRITVLVLLMANGASAATITVPDDYARIQWAIDNAISGDTIEVHNDTYNENVNVNKQLTMRGIGMSAVNAGAITLAADGIILEGFTALITVTSNNNTLIDNEATNHYPSYAPVYGIYLSSSSNNTLINNKANSNSGYEGGYGIFLSSSNNNMLIDNEANSNSGVYGSSSGIYLSASNNNTLIGNNASNNKYGISMSSSSNNTLINNIMTGNLAAASTRAR